MSREPRAREGVLVAHQSGGITETPLEVERGGVALRGVVWSPADGETSTAVVIIAGSGPTDRDGNQAPALQSDTYRMLAEGLAREGVATIRYDKRGVGASGRNFDVSAVVLGDFIDDADAIVAAARERFARVAIAGHSEGGLIALHLAQRAPVTLVLLATPGRTMATLLAEQLNRSASPEGARIVEAFVEALRRDEAIPEDARALLSVFPPIVHPFLRSVLDVDPVALLRATEARATVIQGTTDIQVRVTDAERLGGARADVRVVVLERANHLFKEEAAAEPNQSSYADPSRPLIDGFVRAVAEAVR